MRKGLSLALSLLLAFALTACQGNTASSSEAPASSEASSVAEEPASEPEEEVVEEEPEEEAVDEELEEEPVDVDVQMTGGDNSVSVVVDGQTMATFTLPADNAMFPELKYTEGNLYAMITHPVMDNGVSGRTIVEAAEGTTQDYIRYAAGNLGMDETIQPETKDLNGKEVLVCKSTEQATNNFGSEVIDFSYAVAIPVTENATLGFRIDGSYETDNATVFDDSTLDALLNSCTF